MDKQMTASSYRILYTQMQTPGFRMHSTEDAEYSIIEFIAKIESYEKCMENLLLRVEEVSNC